MTTLTVDVPDSLLSELQQVATTRRVSTESLLVEMAQHSLRETRAEQHSRERAAQGNPKRGLERAS